MKICKLKIFEVTEPETEIRFAEIRNGRIAIEMDRIKKSKNLVTKIITRI